MGLVAHGLSCFAACVIFLDQGSNLCVLHWEADSLPLKPCKASLKEINKNWKNLTPFWKTVISTDHCDLKRLFCCCKVKQRNHRKKKMSWLIVDPSVESRVWLSYTEVDELPCLITAQAYPPPSISSTPRGKVPWGLTWWNKSLRKELVSSGLRDGL